MRGLLESRWRRRDVHPKGESRDSKSGEKTYAADLATEDGRNRENAYSRRISSAFYPMPDSSSDSAHGESGAEVVEDDPWTVYDI